MPIHNQIIVRGNKHTSIATLNPNYRNAQLVVAIGTHKGNHLFHRGHKIQISQPINMLVAIRSNIATKCVVL
jgi:hypothetical protein